MPRNITVGNDTFAYPDNRENPGYGAEATDCIEAIANVLSDVRGPNDIGSTSFTISTFNSNVAVTSLAFSVTAVRAAIVEYSVYRNATAPLAECGTMHIAFNGTTWAISVVSTGDASVTFSVTSGQVSINATSLPGHVSSILKFRARTFSQ